MGATQGPAWGLGGAELGVRTVCGGMDWWVPPVGRQNFPAVGVLLGTEAAAASCAQHDPDVQVLQLPRARKRN